MTIWAMKAFQSRNFMNRVQAELKWFDVATDDHGKDCNSTDVLLDFVVPTSFVIPRLLNYWLLPGMQGDQNFESPLL